MRLARLTSAQLMQPHEASRRRSSVRLEVFDLQGRRIAKLADGFFPAGFHSSGWNGQLAGGGLAQAGVYVYRLQAGSFRAQRKLVLVP